MSSTEIQDAAQLAAGVPPGESLSPRDTELGAAWLDLRGARPEVAIDRAGWVTGALRTCLGLQAGATLFVTTDELDPLATRIASSMLQEGAAARPIAVVRGEDVLARLEEFLLAGCELCDPENPTRSVRDSPTSPSAAIAEPPAGVLREAVEAGAAIVLSRSADEFAMQQALADPPGSQPSGQIEFRYRQAEELRAVILDDRPLELLANLLAASLPGDARWSLEEQSKCKLLVLQTANRNVMNAACRVCQLLLSNAPARLIDQVVTQYECWKTEVPPDMLQFHADLRPAAEWIDT